MAIRNIEGFEHGAAGSNAAGNGSGWNDGNTLGTAGGTPTVQTSNVRTGTYSLRINQSAGASWAGWNPGGNNSAIRFYVYIPTLPSAERILAHFITAAGGTIRISITANNKFGIRITTGSTVELAGQFVANTWHCIDVKFVANSTTYTVDSEFDHAAQTQVTLGSQTSSTVSNIRLGSPLSEALDRYYDDVVVLTADHTFPFTDADTQVGHLIPTADGTHSASMPANTLEKNGGTDFTSSSTDAHQWMDTIPPDNTTYVQQAATATGHYLEVTFGNDADGYDILGACAFICGGASGTATNDIEARISDDAWSTHDVIHNGDFSPGSSAIQVAYLMLSNAITPGGSTVLDSLVGRWGFSGDASPLPRCSLFIVQYLQELPAGTEYPQAVDASFTGTPVVVRRANKPVSIALTATSAVVRAVNKIVAVTVTGTPVITRQPSHLISLGLTGTPTVNKQPSVRTLVIFDVSEGVTVFRSPGKTISVSATLAPVVRATTQKLIAAALSVAPIIKRDVAHTISASLTAATNVVRQVAKTVALTTTGTVAQQSIKVLTKAVDVALSVGVSVSRSVNKVVAYAATLAPTVVRSVAHAISFGVTATSTVVRSVGHTVAAVVTATPNVVRSVGKAVALGVAGDVQAAGQIVHDLFEQGVDVFLTMTPIVVRQVNKVVTLGSTLGVTTTRTVNKTVNVVVAGTVARVATISRAVQLALTATPSVVRQISKFITADTTLDVVATGLKILVRAVDVTLNVSPNVVRSVSKVVNLTAVQTVAVFRNIAHRVDATLMTSVNVVRSLARSVALSLTAAPAASRFVGKTIAATTTMVLDVVGDIAGTYEQAVDVVLNFSVSVSRRVGKLVSVPLTLLAAVRRKIRGWPGSTEDQWPGSTEDAWPQHTDDEWRQG